MKTITIQEQVVLVRLCDNCKTLNSVDDLYCIHCKARIRNKQSFFGVNLSIEDIERLSKDAHILGKYLIKRHLKKRYNIRRIQK